MKRTTRKLVLRTETFRALAGVDPLLAIRGGCDSAAQPCTNLAIFESGAAQCLKASA